MSRAKKVLEVFGFGREARTQRTEREYQKYLDDQRRRGSSTIDDLWDLKRKPQPSTYAPPPPHYSRNVEPHIEDPEVARRRGLAQGHRDFQAHLAKDTNHNRFMQELLSNLAIEGQGLSNMTSRPQDPVVMFSSGLRFYKSYHKDLRMWVIMVDKLPMNPQDAVFSLRALYMIGKKYGYRLRDHTNDRRFNSLLQQAVRASRGW